MKMIVVCITRNSVDDGNYFGMFCNKKQADKWRDEQVKNDKVTGYKYYQCMLDEYTEE